MQMTEVYGNDFEATTSQSSLLRGGKNVVFFNKSYDTAYKFQEEDSDADTLPLLTYTCGVGNGSYDYTNANAPQVCLDSCVCQKVNHSYVFNNRRVSDNNIIAFGISGGKLHY